MTRIISGLGEVVADYDGLLLDLWGTLHDGVRPLPGAVDGMAALHRAGKRLIILSNGPRRADAVAARTQEIGFDPEHCDHTLSSGEMAWRAIRDGVDADHAELGRRCLHMGPPRDAGMLQGLDLDVVPSVNDATFILNTGLAAESETVADHEPLLGAGATRGLPMVCANPDLEVIRDGVREPCAGALAARYEELGGRVLYHGKPHRPIYQACLALLDGMAAGRVLAVGDSLRTDIAGGAAIGADTLLIAGGIHAGTLGLESAGGGIDPERLAELARPLGVAPTFAAAAFAW